MGRKYFDRGYWANKKPGWGRSLPVPDSAPDLEYEWIREGCILCGQFARLKPSHYCKACYLGTRDRSVVLPQVVLDNSKPVKKEDWLKAQASN